MCINAPGFQAWGFFISDERINKDFADRRQMFLPMLLRRLVRIEEEIRQAESPLLEPNNNKL
jgi:hypothetical protein